MNPITIILQTTATYVITLPPYLLPLLESLLIALGYGIGQYIDSINKAGESFNAKMFLKTIIISLAFGYYLFSQGLDPIANVSSFAQYTSANAGLMYIVDLLINSVFNMKGQPIAQKALQS